MVVDKHANAAGIGEIQQGGQVGSTDDGLTLLFLKPSHGRAQQGSADAVANGVQLVFTGRLPDGINSSQGAELHVVFPAFIFLRRPGVAPGHHENRLALVDQPSDKGVPGGQVEDIELVDPGRDNQQWALGHGLCCRRILDQLHQLILVDHLARRCGQVTAHLKCRAVGHGHIEQVRVLAQVFNQVAHAVHQVHALALPGNTQYFRVGQRVVGW